MKRILYIFLKDLKSSFKDFLLLYMIISPIMLAIVIKFFIPDVAANTFTFALDQNIDNEIIQRFEGYGKVELYKNRSEIKERVLRMDDVEGIVLEDGEYIVITQGNEKHLMVESLLKNMLVGENENIIINQSDNNYTISPVASISAACLIIVGIILNGVLIGLSIIDEKESRAIRAIRVSPATKFDYIVGKSLLAFFVLIIQTIGILYILDVMHINLGMILVISLVGYLISLVYGFIIGVTSPNQMAGMATTKALMILVAGSVAGALLLPANWLFVLYWSPMYWIFVGIYNAILEMLTWNQLGLYSLYIIIITAIVFMLFRKKIDSGLNAN